MNSQYPTIFIGYDRSESSAYYTMEHSIHEHASGPVSICPIKLSNLKNIYTRERHPLQATDFSIARFMVPYLMGFEGWALFFDCDMMLRDDIYKLWGFRDNGYAVQVVKHFHQPRENVKMLGQTQTRYEKKNWSSVMLLNCAKCTVLTPTYVNHAEPLDLHRFRWLDHDGLIGEIPHEWNYLVGYDDIADYPNPKNVHWTLGGPYWEGYRGVEFADEWREMYESMIHAGA